MLDVREINTNLLTLKFGKTGKKIIVIIFTFFFLFYPGIESAFAKAATPIKELNRQIKNNDKTIFRLDSDILTYQKKLKGTKNELKKKRGSVSIALGETEKAIKKYDLKIIELEKSIAILEKQVLELKNKEQIETLQLELGKANKSLATTQSTLRNKYTILDSQKRMLSVYDEKNNPNILKLDRLIKNTSAELSKEKYTRKNNLAKLYSLEKKQAAKKKKDESAKKVVKVPKIEKSNKKVQTWVYVINGQNKVTLSDELALRDWVESFGAKYTETTWGSYSEEKGIYDLGFYTQLKSDLETMPKNNKLVLIGRGLGGAAAIHAAASIVYKKERTVDLLAVFDSVGENKLRANIVYQPDKPCSIKNNNADIARYFSCVEGAQRRTITPNVKHFYNRWQKGQGIAKDQRRQYSVSDSQGSISTLSSVTGRFLTSKSTKANQKRFLLKGLSGDESHLVTGASKELANILAPHLQ